MENRISLAPVAIITCNRYKHLKECVESLKRCSLANKTELYISVDYPPSEKYMNGYKETLDYVNGNIDGFKKVNVFVHNKNLGPELNNYWIEDKVFEKHDKIIFSEDDNIFSSNFLIYMNECLNQKNGDKDCYCICGHLYPVNFKYGNNSVVRMYNDFDSWGYATWKGRILEARKKIREKSFIELCYNNQLMKKLYMMNNKLFCYYVDNLYDGTNILKSSSYVTRMVDVSIAINLIINDMYVIVPTINKVRNKGWDGSGTNCPAGSNDLDWENQEIDKNQSFVYKHNSNEEDVTNNIAVMKEYHKEGKLHVIKRVVMLLAFRLRNKHDKIYQ